MTVPTSTAVPSSAPADLLYNAEKIDEAVTSSALSYVDRLGVVRKTLAGAVATISAINTRGAWVTATAYAARDVVSNSGTWYVALDAHTSGATFAGDTAAHWRVFQGALAPDLADTASALKNAGMLGFNFSLSYSTGTLGWWVRAGVKLLDNGSLAHTVAGKTITGSERHLIGNVTPTDDDSALLLARSLTGSIDSGAHGVRDESAYTASGTGFYAYASFDAAASLGGSGAYNHLRGFQARVGYGGSGTLGELTGLHAQSSNTGTGAVSNSFGAFIADPTGTGPITNNYGLWVQPLSRGATVNQAIWTSGSTPSRFGGAVALDGGMTSTAATFTNQVYARASHVTGTHVNFGASGGLGLSYNGSGAGSIQAYANSSGTGTSTLSLVCGSAAITNLSSTALTPGSDNTYTLGGSGLRWSVVWAATGTINTSDERSKTDIEDASLGLGFINALRPVSYLYKVGKNMPVEVEDGTQLVEVSPAKAAEVGPDGEVIFPAVEAVYEEVPKFKTIFEPVPGSRRHWGLISQEVKAAIDASGVDFAGWVQEDVNDPESQQGLRYDQFVAPLIKAVQELSARVARLEAEASAK